MFLKTLYLCNSIYRPVYLTKLISMKKLLLIFSILISTTYIFSQNDSLLLKNGDKIIGELKNMDRGVATFKTAYSDSDFKIEWDGIKEIYTSSSYFITSSDGERFNGTIKTISDNKVSISLEKGGSKELVFMDIVYLKSVDEGLWNKMDAFIDIGLDMTKANNKTTFSTRSGIEYLDQRWSLGLTFNTNFTKQDEGPDTKRTDGALTYNYYLPKDFYIPVSVTYLQSSEQNLNARWNALTGVGYYVLHTNKLYWGFAGGASYNAENYVPDSIPDKNSMEAFFGTELNLFDIGDFSLATKARAFPSITEAGRWRFDINLDTKYDLPLEFYIKLGISMNYDNQPVAGGSDLDYVFYTGFGWEWP